MTSGMSGRDFRAKMQFGRVIENDYGHQGNLNVD
jgi:hypothetical protein